MTWYTNRRLIGMGQSVEEVWSVLEASHRTLDESNAMGGCWMHGVFTKRFLYWDVLLGVANGGKRASHKGHAEQRWESAIN